ncbi:N-acetyltransferase [soil metagenome]
MSSIALPLLDDTVRDGIRKVRLQRPLLSIVPDSAELFFRRAEPADAVAVHALQHDFVERGLLLPRSLEQIYRTIRDYIVAVKDDRVVGCVALRIYTSELAEVGALAVAEELHGTGVGRRLVETVLHDACTLGLRRIFALTLQVGFFHRVGFRTTSIAEFPEKVAADCRACARRHACNEIAVEMALHGDLLSRPIESIEAFRSERG